jgi:hypothetical protein
MRTFSPTAPASRLFAAQHFKERHFADAARRCVGDARDVGRRAVARRADKREHVFNLFALKEFCPKHLVRDLALEQRLFDCARLKVGAVENAKIFRRFLPSA